MVGQVDAPLGAAVLSRAGDVALLLAFVTAIGAVLDPVAELKNSFDSLKLTLLSGITCLSDNQRSFLLFTATAICHQVISGSMTKTFFLSSNLGIKGTSDGTDNSNSQRKAVSF